MAFIPKTKSRSLIVAQPFAGQLEYHITMVEQRELEAMREKLAKQQQKQQRVQAIQKQFVDWAGKKQTIIRSKIQKSTKLKQDHIKKIVKKCKDHQKYIGQRIKIHHKQNKQRLRQAWKKVQEYNKDNENSQSFITTSKQPSPGKSSPKLKDQNQLSQSKVLDNDAIIKKNHEKQYLTLSYNSGSKYLGNSSKQYLKELNQSIKPTTKGLTNTYLTEIEEPEKEDLPKKLKETLARFRNFIEMNEQSKIQQLGERLQRIQKSRLRKHQLNSKKKHHNKTTFEQDQEEGIKAKSKPNRSQRMHSESYMRQRRVKDWSEVNKQKREQMLQHQLQNGTEYLQEQKFKFMKTSLSKKVAISTMEKKLYFQRLNR